MKFQAQGDAQALLNGKREIIRFQIGGDAERDLNQLLEAMKHHESSPLLQVA
jgi:hypothetical protein